MPSEIREPKFGADSFSCPHCHTLAHQDWFSLFLKAETSVADIVLVTPEKALASLTDADDGKGDNAADVVHRLSNSEVTYAYQAHPQSLKVRMVNLHLSSCYNCKGFAVWVRDRLLFPVRVEEGSELSQEDFEEAASILNKSPRGAAALIHLCVQNMVPLLNASGKKLDENISALVSKGLELEIRQDMDVLQVIRRNPLQPNRADLKAGKEAEAKLLKLLNVIMERRGLKTPSNK